jgi:hypothetical protein
VTLFALSVRFFLFLWQVAHPFAFNATLQNFQDFFGYYVKELTLQSQGYLPYRDFPFSYPPLFLYALAPFFKLGADFAAIPIIVADALCAPLIYAIVRRQAGEILAVIASLVFVVSPFFIVYEGLSWLSEEPMLLFLLLSVYLLIEGRVGLSAASFAVSLLFKQDAIFALPAFCIIFYKLYGFRRLAKGAGILLAVVVIVSLPFLVLTPVGYLYSLSLGHIFPSYHPSLSLNSNTSTSGLTLGTFVSTNISFTNLACSSIVNNPFQVSQLCTATEANGSVFTNWISGVPLGTTNALDVITLLLFVPLLPEIVLLAKRRFMTVAFTVSYGVLLSTMIFLGFLGTYKYYLLPFYALMLVSVTGGLSLAIAVAAPILTLILPSYLPGALSSSIVVLVSLQAFVLAGLLHAKHEEGDKKTVRGTESNVI